MRLSGKVAVITGAGSGMGRAMAHLFAKEGARVVAGDWKQDTLAAVVDEVGTAKGEITGVQGDVSIKEDAERLIETALSTYGKLDILCNNAGVMDLMHGVGELSDELWERVMSINVDGPMYASRKAVQYMAQHGGGSIINTASAAGVGGGAAGAAYTVSKHAVVGLTRSTAYIYATKGIRCNCIVAGGVRTNIMGEADMSKLDPFASERLQKYQAVMPAMLEPTDIADLALFLASDESKLINGAAIPADGGWQAA